MTPEQLKAVRLALNLSAEQMGQLVGGADRRTVQRWETGEREIPGTVAVLLALALHCPEAAKMLRVKPPDPTDPILQEVRL